MIMMSGRPCSASASRSSGTSVKVARRQRVHPDDVDVRLDRLPGHLAGRLEQRADVDVEAEIGIRRREHLSARGRDRPGPSSPSGCAVDAPATCSKASVAALACSDEFHGSGLLAIHARDRPDRRLVPAVDRLQRVRYLAHRRLGARGVDRGLEQVPGTLRRTGRVGQGLERPRELVVVTLVAQPGQLLGLLTPDVGVVDLEYVQLVLGVEPVLVDADQRLATGVDPGLGACRRLF